MEIWLEWWERSLKRWVLLIFICIFSILTAGCWDRIEINDLALIMATGVDAASNNKMKVSIQMAIPSQGESQNGSMAKTGKSYFVVADTGSDIWGTTSRIQEKLSRRVFTAHRRILIIGEKLASQGIQPILDAFVRHPESRLRTYVVVAKGATAEKILKASYPLEKAPTEGIRELLHSQIGLVVDLKDLLMDRSSNQSIVLPTIEITNGKGSSKVFRLSGAAVFHHDKLAGYLGDHQTRELIWLRGKPLKAELSIKIPKLKGRISADILKKSTNMKARKIHGRMVMKIDTSANIGISENQTKLDLEDPETIHSIERLFAKELKNKLHTTLKEIQQNYQSDVVGFGEVIHRTYPKDWKGIKQNWDMEFPQIKVVLHTDVKIKRTGMTSLPINIPEKQIRKSLP